MSRRAGIPMNKPTDWQAADYNDFLLTKAARETSDYQIFGDAYRDWYGHEPTQNTLERVFGAYLKSGDLPHYVRHYAREYVASHPGPVQTLVERHRQSQRANVVAFGMLVVLVLFAMAIA